MGVGVLESGDEGDNVGVGERFEDSGFTGWVVWRGWRRGGDELHGEGGGGMRMVIDGGDRGCGNEVAGVVGADGCGGL